MNAIVGFVLLLMVSCGKNSTIEDEKDLDLRIIKKDSFELPDVTDEKLQRLQSLLDEFMQDPSDLGKFKKIEGIIKSFEVKKKIIKLLEEKLAVQDNMPTLNFLLDKLYFYEGNYNFKDYKYKTIFNTIRNDQSTEIEIENRVLADLVEYYYGEELNLSESNRILDVLRDEFDIEYVDIRDFIALNFSEEVIHENSDTIIINLKNIKYRFKLEKTILVSNKTLKIVADELYFDLLSGIKVLNGNSLEITSEYLENGIFFTGVDGKMPKARNGKNGKNATKSRNPTAGQSGTNGGNGINGGNIVLDIKKIANSSCDIKVCRTVLVVNGQNGQDGGDGGKGGDGLIRRVKSDNSAQLDQMNCEVCTPRVSYEYLNIGPAEGGVPGRKGKYGRAGNIILKESLFKSKSLISYKFK